MVGGMQDLLNLQNVSDSVDSILRDLEKILLSRLTWSNDRELLRKRSSSTALRTSRKNVSAFILTDHKHPAHKILSLGRAKLPEAY